MLWSHVRDRSKRGQTLDRLHMSMLGGLNKTCTWLSLSAVLVLTCRGCSLKAWTCHSLFIAELLSRACAYSLLTRLSVETLNRCVDNLNPCWNFESVCWHFESVCLAIGSDHPELARHGHVSPTPHMPLIDHERSFSLHGMSDIQHIQGGHRRKGQNYSFI
jgi:hypothetical protein